MSNERLEVLGGLPLFEPLSPDERERLAVECRMRRFARGAALFREGERADGMHIVLRGVVKVVRFATDGRELSGLAGLYLEELDALFGGPGAPQGIGEGPVRYLGCGLVGRGLQSWQFRYLLDAGRLRLGLSLPWGRAWGDPEAERLSLEAACRFIEACQACLPRSGVLSVVLDAERCAWRLDTSEGEVRQQGEGLDALLDLMQGFDSGPAGIPNVNWMRV